MLYRLKRVLKEFVNNKLQLLKDKKSIDNNDVDYNRWSQSKSLFKDWDERTALLAVHIPENSTVFEFGAARLTLKEMLPSGCSYLHSDLVARAEDTYVVDLNKEMPSLEHVDVVVFSGVLEYLLTVQNLMLHLKDHTKIILFSYATTNSFNDKAVRRSHGWLSDHNLGFFEELAKSCNFKQEVIGIWRNQNLFKWTKNH